MELNLIAYAIIAVIPVIIAALWYHPKSSLVKWAGEPIQDTRFLSIRQMIGLYLISLMVVFGYMNLIIHQIGFYELFFTDIMRGDETARQVAEDFLSKYGDKHRHLGHGLFHGVIIAVAFPMSFYAMQCILTQKSWKYWTLHSGYWLLTSIVVGGLIAEFV